MVQEGPRLVVLKGSESSTGYVRKAQTPMTLHPSGLSRQIYATRKGFLSPPKSRLVQVSSQLVTRDPLLPENALAKKKKKEKPPKCEEQTRQNPNCTTRFSHLFLGRFFVLFYFLFKYSGGRAFLPLRCIGLIKLQASYF